MPIKAKADYEHRYYKYIIENSKATITGLSEIFLTKARLRADHKDKLTF